ncbi:Organic cation/carnitine transporter 7 [Turnera subulata]|uniref:Organic cation/carnitine transporter 7 n=1 Tax=Turnera subulata TaxID=218843 RepID=A0A9Q0G6I9_9ROSI|nr:Organic cation/carnitine transporter 7 [Turnera subulata]
MTHHHPPGFVSSSSSSSSYPNPETSGTTSSSSSSHSVGFFGKLSRDWFRLIRGQSSNKLSDREGKFSGSQPEERSAFIVSDSLEMADGGSKYTVDDALLTMGFGKFQFFVLLYAGMGWISEAMEMMILSFIGPAVKIEWSLTSNQESAITTVVFVGMLVGAYSWGAVSDKFGRRKGFLVTAIITSAAGFMSAFAPNYTTLIISRCLVGLGLGGGPVLLAWFLEFVPAPNRGTWMVIFSAFWTFGAIFEAALAWIIMPGLGWRWLLGASSLPSFLLLVFYAFTPESPRYLCLKGKKMDASKILEKIAELNGKELPPGVLVSDSEIELQSRCPPAEDAPPVSTDKDAAAASHPPPPPAADSAPPKWKDSDMGAVNSLLLLVSPKLIRSTLLLWAVFFGNAFSYYGLVLLTTELNNKDNKCYSTQVQSQKSASHGVNYRDVFITSFAEFPGLIISALIVDRIGRKLSMAAMFFVCCVFLLPLVVHQPAGITTILLFGARICITGSFTIVYIFAPEIYPTSVRSTGIGIASSMGRIGGAVCPLVAVSLVQGCHQREAVILFVGIVFVAGVCVLLFPYDTKGLELTESISSTKHDKQKVLRDEV